MPKLLDPASSAFVWLWLPGAAEPVVCGRIQLVGDIYNFTYGKSYLRRKDCIPVWLPELPLVDKVIVPEAPHTIAGSLRDSAPDQWGRRVVLNRQFDRKGRDVDTSELDELNYMLLSGSDRIGALDFQVSPTDYVPRQNNEASLAQMLNAAELVEQGIPLPPELDAAMNHGTSIGGARPKAQLIDGDRKVIAKFPSSRDTHNVVKGECLGMRIAAIAGLDVAPVELVNVQKKDVLIVERFDRYRLSGGWGRRAVVSSLTLQGLDENAARYASYSEIATQLRHRSANPVGDPHELWSRMLFNILIGNTDDHARNHAVIWNGSDIRLTPAYDIDPRPRLGREANQAMEIAPGDRRSRIASALASAGMFGIREPEAQQIAIRQITCIRKNFRRISEEIGLSPIDQEKLARRAVLNPYAFEDAPDEIAALDQEF